MKEARLNLFLMVEESKGSASSARFCMDRGLQLLPVSFTLADANLRHNPD